jgi:hypothetical protein
VWQPAEQSCASWVYIRIQCTSAHIYLLSISHDAAERYPLHRVFCLILLLTAPGIAQLPAGVSTLPDAPGFGAMTEGAPALVADAQAAPQGVSSSQTETKPQGPAETPATGAVGQPPYNSQQQPKRILGVMPNYRAVTAGTIPPPPNSREAFKIATENSFDYSSFVFTGLTSLMAKGTDAHPDLGKGPAGLWAYTWRGFLDKTDGNYMVIWALPTLLHEDERYYAMGHGSKWRRLGYSLSQVGVARSYDHRPVPNLAELLGRAGAQAVSTTYYPAADNNFPDVAAKYSYALLRDGLTNAFREFWPDIATHVLHRQP